MSKKLLLTFILFLSLLPIFAGLTKASNQPQAKITDEIPVPVVSTNTIISKSIKKNNRLPNPPDTYLDLQNPKNYYDTYKLSEKQTNLFYYSSVLLVIWGVILVEPNWMTVKSNRLTSYLSNLGLWNNVYRFISRLL